MTVAHLTIGTSTDRINLLNPNGFHLDNWAVGGYEPEGIWQESKLADFRQLAAYRDVTVIERFELVLKAGSQDMAARMVQDMRAMLRLCLDYWTTTWQTSVVYLAVRASCETNMRYAVVYDARLVNESNPLGQPFVQRGNRAVMDALGLLVERGPWLDDVPGTAACIEISSQGPDVSLYCLDFDGADDDVNCGSDASLDNLPSTHHMTAEAWILADGWGENSLGRIFDKNAWRIYISPHPDVGLMAVADHATTWAASSTGTDEFSPDGQWHHILCQWSMGLKLWEIAIDGHWVDSYGFYTAGVGAYSGDAADDLIIGNNAAGSATWNGKIGWCRISNVNRYKIGNDFTPLPRCEFPATDANTELLIISEGTGATTYDASANGNDGTITGATWMGACLDSHEYMEATCEARSVFAANKHNVAQITHCYFWDEDANQWTDGGVPPNNLIGDATPYAFLPAVPGVDDCVIFGCNTAYADSGPFCSLIFDIGTAIDPGTGITLEWRYKGTVGADTDDPATWTALTVQDNTNQHGDMTGDPFDTTGIGSVHWEVPSDWVTSDPNPGVLLGVTGYWIAAYVTASNDDGTPPTQDNRDIYTVTWPYVEFTADEIEGDLPALLRLSVDNRAARNGVGTTTDLYAQRMIAGLRSYDRGENFTAYVNISDEQNGPDITIDLLGSMAAWSNLVTAPTGRISIYTPGGAVAMANQVLVRLSSDFYGRFHAFVRGTQLSGNAGEVIVRLGYAAADTYFPANYTTTRIFTQGTAADDQLLDFGEITIGPDTAIVPLEVSHPIIMIQAQSTAVATAVFYELILIPIDEWAVDAEDVYKNTGGTGYTNDYWSHYEIDGIRNPRNLLSYLIANASGGIARYWRPITNGIPILQTGKKQRLWFLLARNDDYSDVDDVRADSEMCSAIQVWKQQRYTTLRGDR